MKRILLAALLAALSCQLHGQTVVTGLGQPNYYNFWSTTGLSPAAATTYYVGPYASANTNNAAISTFIVPNACRISDVTYHLAVAGTKDTAAENFTLKVYDLTTSTAFADTAGTLTAQTTIEHSVMVSGANDAVAKGDQLLLQIVTPASFTVAPTSITFVAQIVCR
jgi:hypothetical protein